MSMFGTPKPTASLSSGLLARKGHARPAMRPQGFVSHGSHAAEDLGWNDMGNDMGEDMHAHRHPVPAPAAVVVPVAPPPVLQQRAELEEQLAPEVAAPAPAAKPLPARAVARVVREVKAATRNSSKAAFTLRLDTDRHLRLRLASAVHNRSAQQLVTEALDAFLESLTDVDALATQLSTRESRG